MKILICGDSFAADWTVKYSGKGWPNLLDEKYDVTNLAQAGCSEYKIYLQLCSANLSLYDVIIVSHTSPFRLPVKIHPVHADDVLHKNCDLIYSDIKEHSLTNTKLLSIVDYFERYFDEVSAKFTHKLICKEIDSLLKYNKSIHLTNLPVDSDGFIFDGMLNFVPLLRKHRGNINHFDDFGNQHIFKKLDSLIAGLV